MVTKAEDPIVEAQPSALDTAIDAVHELAATQRLYARILLSGSKTGPVRRPLLFTIVALCLAFSLAPLGFVALGLLMLGDNFAAEA